MGIRTIRLWPGLKQAKRRNARDLWELARESGMSVNDDVEFGIAFASRLAPTRSPVDRMTCIHHQSPVGGELARESGLSVKDDVESDIAFASKLAPTRAPVDRRIYIHHQSPVGASLLAKADCQPRMMLNLILPSRASSLPQDLRLTAISAFTTNPLWERACSRKRNVSQR